MPVPRLPKQDYIGTEPEGIDLKVKRKRSSQFEVWQESFLHVVLGIGLAFLSLGVLEIFGVVSLKDSKYAALI